MRKILRLKDIEAQLPFKVSVGLSMPYIKDWVSNTYNDEIDWDVYLPSKKMNLQRGFVWTDSQKEELIKSILKGIYIPPICAVQYREYPNGESKPIDRKTTYKIIDGKQRFSTILSFAKGEFAINYEGNQYYITDLDEWASRKILLMMPTFNIVYEYPDTKISDEGLIKWFELLNFAGTPQDIEHFRKLKQ